MRFLFFFSDTGGGHRASAQAVRDEMARLYGAAAQVEMVDFFKAMGRWPFHRMPAWYPSMVGLQGVPWSIGYRLTDGQERVKALAHLAWPYAGPPFRRVVHRHPADVLVSFHAAANYPLMMLERRAAERRPLATVALDLVTVHAAWFPIGYDLYVVPTAEAKVRAMECGVDGDRIEVVGMPVRRSFVEAARHSRDVARAKLGLPAEGPIVLLVGGGDGVGPLARVVTALVARRPRAHLVVIAGKNRALRETLEARTGEVRPPTSVRVEGFVTNMETWMRAADLLVTKAGPNTLSEAFIAGLPVILYDAIPGQEEGNVSYTVDHGAGVWAPRSRLVVDAVLELLDDPHRRRAMAEHSRALARPEAATVIARRLWLLGQQERLAPREANRRRKVWGEVNPFA
jgi:1,2-diacylglycerol 3-beta-galactosyltransferase